MRDVIKISFNMELGLDERETRIYKAMAKEFGEEPTDDAIEWVVQSLIDKKLDKMLLDLDLGDISEDVREILMQESLDKTF